MPTLNWIGKDAVLNHHAQVPYRLLHCNGELSVGDAGSGNLLVEGDNLHALKALLPYYRGQVKCIYIDPPYNTGDENWVYNDNVNSTEIRKWLGHVVGGDVEDLSRHDKWLCMLYPRIVLLREFLREDGVIFVSIDENEVGHLTVLMDEIFKPTNKLGTLVWKRRSSSAMRGMPLSIDHEYLLVYSLDSSKTKLYGLPKSLDRYPNKDEHGQYASTDLTIGMGKDARPGQFYSIKNPRTGKVYKPNPERVWRFYPPTMKEIIDADLIIWPDEVGGNMERPRYKTYYDPNSEKLKPVSSWIETANTNDREIEEDETEYDISILTSGMNQDGGRLLQQMLGTKIFLYPKPLSLLRSLIRASTRDTDIVMDSFAGTGTTGHAVLNLNQEDGGERRFLLIELETEICRSITAERLRRAITGYSYKDAKGKKKKVEGLGGGFRFCTLGEPLFDERGKIRANVKFADLARHIFFTETGTPLPQRGNGRAPLIGKFNGTAYYLLWDAENPTVLNGAALRGLPKHDGTKVVFADGCRLSAARLKRERVVFKQIPYEIKQT